MLSAANFMMITIFSGFVLSGTYFRALFLDWRRRHKAEFKRKVEIRRLYRVELSHPQDSVGARAAVLADRSSVSGSHGMPRQEVV
jgi:hypothetical protein